MALSFSGDWRYSTEDRPDFAQAGFDDISVSLASGDRNLAENSYGINVGEPEE